MLRTLFATTVLEGRVDDAALLDDLRRSVAALAQDDGAGRAWSRDHGYHGYTSYASLNDLAVRDPAFADLLRPLNKQVRAFANACGFQLARPLKCNSLWVNVLRPGGHHSAHIHPHSVVSGTVYLTVPDGAGALKLEDPRLPMMMAAPVRRPDADPSLQPFATLAPAVGTVYLWESWLRHEVLPNRAKTDRVSISFNYS